MVTRTLAWWPVWSRLFLRTFLRNTRERVRSLGNVVLEPFRHDKALVWLVLGLAFLALFIWALLGSRVPRHL